DESHSLLKQKGDGIKARYIPELLRFINENEGRSRYYIWGFEEPENSLDLEAAQKEAQRFAAYAGRGDTQVFITSHSPAFYLAQGDGQETTRRYFITKQQVLAGQAVPADAVAEIDELSQAEEKMNAAGLLELPFVISAMKEEREQRLAAEEEAAVYREEAEALREELHTLEVPTLFVEGEHDLVLFKDALERINLKDKIELKALRGTPNTASTIMKQLVKAGFNADAGAFFLFDNDEAGRKALFALCGKTSATDPIKVQGNVHAWVLPINQEYREFQQRLKIPEREATFVAEFLFPANDAARINGEILGEINDGDDAFWPVHPNVVGQVGCMLGVKHAEKEKLKHDLNRAAAHTPDFLFSRCVGNAEKHSYAERVVNEELDTAQVDAITTKVAQTLGVLEA
ncbi:MAG TPA: hypothetical protein ENK83_04615, partial [Aliiroseovarius sp.]|nr:hypothetical protein [Aliiroseovarius sp.]